MYAIVCSAASDALDLLPCTDENAAARDRLAQALIDAEELYLSAEDEPVLHLLPHEGEDNTPQAPNP